VLFKASKGVYFCHFPKTFFHFFDTLCKKFFRVIFAFFVEKNPEKKVTSLWPAWGGRGRAVLASKFSTLFLTPKVVVNFSKILLIQRCFLCIYEIPDFFEILDFFAVFYEKGKYRV
jgi:hypothetical protein